MASDRSRGRLRPPRHRHVAGHQHQQVFAAFDLSQSADSGLFGRLPRETTSANQFTDFDPNDNIQLHQLALPHQAIRKPFHILNIAINLVRAENLAWQQRKAQSFTASPLFCGSWNLGYRRSSEYGVNGQLRKAITLGTAMAISGAAASPNMGYHSAPPVTFLLAFFNVRLGWWLGNPGPAGRNTFARSCPRIAVRPLLAETFGLTDAANPYVYLSDGGHFENLGLYEMVLRRCHYIVVSDGSCDTDRSFTDLGNAIRKIRIDLGIDIDIDAGAATAADGESLEPARISRWALSATTASIGSASPGLLIYLKPSLTGNEPADVTEYASCHDEFPHEPTADQFFDESQFESYRALGFHIADKVFSASHHQPNRTNCRSSTAPNGSSKPTPSDRRMRSALISNALRPGRCQSAVRTTASAASRPGPRASP